MGHESHTYVHSNKKICTMNCKSELNSESIKINAFPLTSIQLKTNVHLYSEFVIINAYKSNVKFYVYSIYVKVK